MRYVHYRDGLKLDRMKCPWCRTKQTATVISNRIRWMHRYQCGHINVAGYKMPPNVLEEQGLANYKLDESPVYAWEERNKRLKEREKLRSYDEFMKAEEEGTGKRYTPVSKMQIGRRAEK